MLTGAVVKGAAGYFLLGIPGVGINGAAIGTVLCYAVVATINLTVLSFDARHAFDLRDLTRPILPAGLAVALAFPMQSILPDRTTAFSTLFLLATVFLLYIPLSFLFGSVTLDDAESIPLLRKLTDRLRIRERAK